MTDDEPNPVTIAAHTGPVVTNAHIGQAITKPWRDRDAQEKWIVTLGTELVEVFFVDRKGLIFHERHVADPETLEETVRMTLARFPGSRAVIPSHGGWVVLAAGGPRSYPTREAAEMAAIHRAG